MLKPNDKQLEALAKLARELPKEFDQLHGMLVMNADVQRRQVVALGCPNRDELCGRAQVFQEIADICLKPEEIWKTRKAELEAQEDAEQTEETPPPLLH